MTTLVGLGTYKRAVRYHLFSHHSISNAQTLQHTITLPISKSTQSSTFKMKTVFALSAVISSAFAAAAAASSSASLFELVISNAQSRATELKGRALISQGDAFILAPAGEHGINFTGGNGSLGIQNGDVGEFCTLSLPSRLFVY